MKRFIVSLLTAGLAAVGIAAGAQAARVHHPAHARAAKALHADRLTVRLENAAYPTWLAMEQAEAAKADDAQAGEAADKANEAEAAEPAEQEAEAAEQEAEAEAAPAEAEMPVDAVHHGGK
jgi:hypothetical protein